MTADPAASMDDLLAQARAATVVDQVTTLTRWVGPGRKLTDAGRLTLADARELVALLGTGDEMDRVIGDRTFRTRSSEDLSELTIIVTWAKAAGFLRAQQGRLVPVKKNAARLDRPVEVWCALFESFDRLGEAIYPPNWFVSLFSTAFDDGVAWLFDRLARSGGSMTLADAGEDAWQTLSPRFRLDALSDPQRSHVREQTDRDVSRAVDLLVALGALRRDEPGAVSLTPLAHWAVRRPYTIAKVGQPVAVLRVTLVDSQPPIWRRLLVPANIRLDRLHDVIQAAMGWEDYHLHAFTDGTDRYGRLDDDDDAELGHRDERAVPLSRILGPNTGPLRYEYDFGDSWEHDIVLEAVVAATAEDRYPSCVAGERAGPPEDCGGIGGYEELQRALADPHHPDHEHLREWVGLPDGVTWDAAGLDLAKANARIDAAIQARGRRR